MIRGGWLLVAGALLFSTTTALVLAPSGDSLGAPSEATLAACFLLPLMLLLLSLRGHTGAAVLLAVLALLAALVTGWLGYTETEAGREAWSLPLLRGHELWWSGLLWVPAMVLVIALPSWGPIRYLSLGLFAYTSTNLLTAAMWEAGQGGLTGVPIIGDLDDSALTIVSIVYVAVAVLVVLALLRHHQPSLRWQSDRDNRPATDVREWDSSWVR